MMPNAPFQISLTMDRLHNGPLISSVYTPDKVYDRKYYDEPEHHNTVSHLFGSRWLRRGPEAEKEDDSYIYDTKIIHRDAQSPWDPEGAPKTRRESPGPRLCQSEDFRKVLWFLANDAHKSNTEQRSCEAYRPPTAKDITSLKAVEGPMLIRPSRQAFVVVKATALFGIELRASTCTYG